MPMPALAMVAPPPDPWCAEVRCASESVGFHPSRLASLCADLAVPSDRILVSWAKMMSALDLMSMALARESHELPLQVSTAHEPLGTHHLELVTIVPRSPT